MSTATGNGTEFASQSGLRSSPTVAAGLGNGQGHTALEVNSAHGVDLSLGVPTQEAMAPMDMHLHRVSSNESDQRLDPVAQTSLMLTGEKAGPVLNTTLDFEDMDFASALQCSDDLLQPQMQLSLSILPSSVVGETDASWSCNNEEVVPSR
jgi:hypothetical protein